jgi:hypothetical protein
MEASSTFQEKTSLDVVQLKPAANAVEWLCQPIGCHHDFLAYGCMIAPVSAFMLWSVNPRACKEQFFDIPIAEAETVIKPHAVADELCGKPVLVLSVGRRRGVHATIMSH